MISLMVYTIPRMTVLRQTSSSGKPCVQDLRRGSAPPFGYYDSMWVDCSLAYQTLSLAVSEPVRREEMKFYHVDSI